MFCIYAIKGQFYTALKIRTGLDKVYDFLFYSHSNITRNEAIDDNKTHNS